MSLRDDLVAHWSFEETGGVRVDDHGAGQLNDNNTVLSATGVVGNAADFEASNSEYLSAALTDMGASPGDKDLTVVGWFRLESKGATRTLKAVDRGSTAGRSWRLEYNTTNDRFRFIAFGASNAVVGDVYANNLGSPSTATDYFIEAWHSATDNEVGIRVNNGTADTAATTGAMLANQTAVWFGAIGSGGSGSTPASFHDGLTDEAAIWRRLLTADERTQLYNSGSGYGWSNWFTDSGMAPLHIAHAADVLAYDATGFTYETTVSVTQTGRHAIGVMLLQSDDADQIRLKIGGSTVETRTVDDDRLSNKKGSYFEDGFIYDFTTTGSKTITVESVSNASVIKGIIVREPDAVSGIVEEQGVAHCAPLQVSYGGSTYSLHVEMYTGNIYLCIDGALQGLLFAGDEYNERYHNSAAIVALSSGVVVFQASHTASNGVRARYLPSGNYGSITAEYEAFGTLDITYLMAVVLADDRVAVMSNVGGDAALLIFSDLDQIGGTGASATIDYVFTGLSVGAYPVECQYFVNGGTEVVATMWNMRDGGNDWDSSQAALFCPQEGSFGKWYSLNGDDATVQTALGTAGSPRFNDTMRDTTTSSGAGISLVNSFTGQRYGLCGLFKIKQWPSGATPAKGACLYLFADAASTGLNEYASSDVVMRYAIMDEGTRTLNASFNDVPTAAEFGTSNSYRLSARLMWEDDDDTGDALLAITDRRWGKTGSGKGTTYEECGPYYDWGAHAISVLRIANPHNPAAITFAQEKRIEVPSKYRAAFITKAGVNSIAYEPGDNQLHMTHRQTTRRTALIVEAAAVLTPASALHGHGADAVALAATAVIAPADAAHAHSADAAALTADAALAPADATHGHAADAPALTTSSAIAPADATHAHSADAAALTADATLEPADATHAHTADQPALSTDAAIAPADATHAHAADQIVLSALAVLTPADALHAHAADAPAVTYDAPGAATLTPADAAHAHTADAASLTAAAVLAIADALHAHSAAGVVLTPEAVLAIADALHAHAADPTSLDTQQTLVIADGLHAHTSDGVALTATAVLVPASALHGHTAAVAVLSQQAILPITYRLPAEARTRRLPAEARTWSPS